MKTIDERKYDDLKRFFPEDFPFFFTKENTLNRFGFYAQKCIELQEYAHAVIDELSNNKFKSAKNCTDSSTYHTEINDLLKPMLKRE